MSTVIARARGYGDRIAIVDASGSHPYAELAEAADAVAAGLAARANWAPGERVATMINPSFEYVAALWGIWSAGGIAVPLALTHTNAELQYLIEDSEAGVVASGPEFYVRLQEFVPEQTLVTIGDLLSSLPTSLTREIGEDAMLLYTSGTTGRAKGVVWRHAAIAAQANILTQAWGWQPDDRALLALPLHHVHGLINVVTTALWNGACVEMLPRFDADAAWERLGSGDLTVFMAVPTIYHRLIASWETMDAEEQTRSGAGLQAMRLMVSGSAALPVPTLERWREISGHTLLERYGMTEIGMALSNPYDGDRIPGVVGEPLPTVEARVVDDADVIVEAGAPGQLQVRGPSVFQRYWRRAEATAESFIDGWFRTGDVVQVEDGNYRILGRSSVDIIKTGGEKVSALEIEDVLRRHPAIADCAVVGIPDEEWGELVAVAVAIAPGEEAPELPELRIFCRETLAPHKIPRRLAVVVELPRNALGKVMKPQVKDLFGS